MAETLPRTTSIRSIWSGWIWESKDEGVNWQKVYCYTDIINADEKKEGECHAYIREKETICIDIEYEFAEDIVFKTKCYFIDENNNCIEIENNSEGISYCDDKYKGLGYVSNIVNDDILLLTNEGNEVFIVNKEAGNSMKNILTKGEKLISKNGFVIKEDKIFLITTLVSFSISINLLAYSGPDNCSLNS